MSIKEIKGKNYMFAKQWKPNYITELYTGNEFNYFCPLSAILLVSKAILLVYFCQKGNLVYFKS